MTVTVIEGDCLKIMPTLSAFDCVFMDPPDNIGLAYAGVDDRWPSDPVYIEWLGEVVFTAWRPSTVVWVSFNAKWTVALGHELTIRGLRPFVKPCVQTFTFGQHRQTDFGNGHRPLWRVSDGAPFYADQVRVESERQRAGDKRANPDGRVPGDVFDFPRVTGNSKQRRRWHPTQLHESLVERCILSCTKPGDRVLDPFGGTGTTARVCDRLERDCVLIEKSPVYAEKLREEYETLRAA